MLTHTVEKVRGHWLVRKSITAQGRQCVAVGAFDPPDPEVGLLRPVAIDLYVIDHDGELLILPPAERLGLLNDLRRLVPDE